MSFTPELTVDVGGVVGGGVGQNRQFIGWVKFRVHVRRFLGSGAHVRLVVTCRGGRGRRSRPTRAHVTRVSPNLVKVKIIRKPISPDLVQFRM